MTKRKKYTIWIIILAIIVGGVYFYVKSKKPQTTYETSPVVKGDLFQTVSVTGKINPDTQIDLSFKTSGLVDKTLVSVGDKIIKGQKLASLDRRQLSASLRQSQAGEKYQKETLNNMKKHSSLYTDQQEKAQKANVVASKAATDIIFVQLEDTWLKSPIDGIVISKNIEQGENSVANTALFTVAPEGDLIVQSNIPESDIVKIKIGQKAQLTLDAFPSDQKFNAVVSEIDPASVVIQDVVYYKIKLKLDSIDASFKPGMSADIDVRTNEKNGVLFIPLRAVKTENGQKVVEVLKDEKNNIVEKRNVQLGLEGDEGMVEILSGLKEGEKVVVLTTTK